MTQREPRDRRRDSSASNETVSPSAPPRRPGARRVECACGCRVWFYVPRQPGRPRRYVNRDHFEVERLRRRLVVVARKIEAAP